MDPGQLIILNEFKIPKFNHFEVAKTVRPKTYIQLRCQGFHLMKFVCITAYLEGMHFKIVISEYNKFNSLSRIAYLITLLEVFP